LAGIVQGFAPQEALGMRRRQPSPFLGDADRHYFIFVFIDGLEDGGRGKQRDLMLATAPAKENADAEFLHLVYFKAAVSTQQSAESPRRWRSSLGWVTCWRA